MPAELQLSYCNGLEVGVQAGRLGTELAALTSLLAAQAESAQFWPGDQQPAVEQQLASLQQILSSPSLVSQPETQRHIRQLVEWGGEQEDLPGWRLATLRPHQLLATLSTPIMPTQTCLFCNM